MSNESNAATNTQKWQEISDKDALNAYLNEFAQRGDEYVDKLARETLSQNGGRLEYNKLLILFNKLSEHPSLLFAPHSEVATEISKYASSDNATDQQLAEYFQPIEAPIWVDAEKLALASKVWKENTIVALGALYAASLPSCYLIKYGIPALYDSKRLLDEYLPQRIYETGLFVEAVLDAGGITVVQDEVFDITKVVDQALGNVVQGWTKQDGELWTYQDGNLHRIFGNEKKNAREFTDEKWQGLSLNPNLPNALAGKKWYEAVEWQIQNYLENRPRYLMGKGYLTTKKVRFYHSSMRHMLLNAKIPAVPESKRERDTLPWNSAKFGGPVNQLDQAYTLLTFSLDIPRGLEKWGVSLSLQEKEAFLHLWKVVGYILGIKEELLTDNWQEAEKLYNVVREMRGGGSPDGVALTKALINVLQDYVPKVPGTDQNCAPIQLIISLMGEEAAKQIISEKDLKAASIPWRRFIYKVAGIICKLYFILRSRWLKRMPALGQLSVGLVHKVGEEMVQSWRDAYRREPFFVPRAHDSMERLPGADKTFLAKLKHWRSRVLLNAGIGLALLAVAVMAISVAFPLWIIAGQTAFFTALGISGGSWLLFNYFATRRLNDVLNDRPKTAGEALKVQVLDADVG